MPNNDDTKKLPKEYLEKEQEVVEGLMTFDDLLALSRLSAKVLKKVIYELGFRRSKHHGTILFRKEQAEIILDAIACSNENSLWTQDELTSKFQKARTVEDLEKLIRKHRTESTRVLVSKLLGRGRDTFRGTSWERPYPFWMHKNRYLDK